MTDEDRELITTLTEEIRLLRQELAADVPKDVMAEKFANYRENLRQTRLHQTKESDA